VLFDRDARPFLMNDIRQDRELFAFFAQQRFGIGDIGEIFFAVSRF
jgi:hypothetical protein